jgi:polyphosphate glucokinase
MRNNWATPVPEENSMTILGIDIGGSGVKGAIVDTGSGRLVTDRFRLETPMHAKPKDIALVLQEIVRHFTWTGLIGCGFPAIIQKGIALNAANISRKWIGTNVDRLLGEATGCEVHTLNDADAAGLAEMMFGAGREARTGVTILLTLGTGIGSAVFVKGNLLPNTELGHLEIRGKDAEKRASDAARRKKGFSWKQWSKRLQEFLATLEYLFSPDVFILGGGISKEADKFVPFLRTRAVIKTAQLQNQAGIVGAALYASSWKR